MDQELFGEMTRENYTGLKEEQMLLDYLMALRSKRQEPYQIIDIIDLATLYIKAKARSITATGREYEIAQKIVERECSTEGLDELFEQPEDRPDVSEAVRTLPTK